MTQDLIDVYRTDDLTERYQAGRAQLADFLDKHGVVRVTATLDPNIVLNDTVAIAANLGEKLTGVYSESVIEATQKNLSRFLRVELLGIDYNECKYVGLAKAPLACPTSKRYLRAVEEWLVPSPRREGSLFPIMTALYGLTDPEFTGREGQNLSSAFMHQKGWHLSIAALQHIFGRNWYPNFSYEMAGSHFANACRNPVFNIHSLGGSDPTIYHSYPFSTTRDVITYPAQPSEFGAETYSDPEFLRVSIEAKALIRDYFEDICDQEIPITSSLPKERLDNPPQKREPNTEREESRIRIIRRIR